MNDEDQEVPLYNKIFQYLKHGEYRVDASKSEKRAIRRRAHSFVMKKGLLYLKSSTADMTCNSGLLRAFDTTHTRIYISLKKIGLVSKVLVQQ